MTYFDTINRENNMMTYFATIIGMTASDIFYYKRDDGLIAYFTIITMDDNMMTYFTTTGMTA